MNRNILGVGVYQKDTDTNLLSTMVDADSKFASFMAGSDVEINCEKH